MSEYAPAKVAPKQDKRWVPADYQPELEADPTRPLESTTTVRQDLLDQARQIISADRNLDYGTPEENFQTIARLWSEFIDFSLEPHQVAAMLALVKVARIKQSPRKMDHWIDIAGYAACGGEVADNGL